MIDLSVIIVSYNHFDLLQNCLDSIEKFNDIGERLEVIVSDNSPICEVYDKIVADYHWVKIIKNENVGFGAGNNRGFEISNGKYLLFLNPDTILVEPIFAFAIEKFEQNNDLALFGLQLKDTSLNNVISFACIDTDNAGIWGHVREKKRIKKGRFIDDGMLILGADMFVRREAFVQAGRFDEKIFMYREEEDLVKRIKKESEAKAVRFFGEKSIIHLEGGTEDKDYNSLFVKTERLCQTDSYYTKKWGLDFCKILKKRIRFYKFSVFVNLFLFRIEKAKEKKILLKVFRDELIRQKSLKNKKTEKQVSI